MDEKIMRKKILESEQNLDLSSEDLWSVKIYFVFKNLKIYY